MRPVLSKIHWSSSKINQLSCYIYRDWDEDFEGEPIFWLIHLIYLILNPWYFHTYLWVCSRMSKLHYKVKLRSRLCKEANLPKDSLKLFSETSVIKHLERFRPRLFREGNSFKHSLRLIIETSVIFVHLEKLRFRCCKESSFLRVSRRSSTASSSIVPHLINRKLRTFPEELPQELETKFL